MMGLTPGPLVCALFLSFSGKSVGSVGKSVGGVSGVGSCVFVLTGLKSVGDVVLFVMFVPRGVKSKGGRIIELFCRPKS